MRCPVPHIVRATGRCAALFLLLASAAASGARADASWTGPLLVPKTSRHAIAYDDARQVVVLFGGTSVQEGTANRSDTWEWDGNRWNQRRPATSPVARTFHAMAYDGARQRTVLFGGTYFDSLVGDIVYGSDTWTWDGTNWSQIAPAVAPTGRAR